LGLLVHLGHGSSSSHRRSRHRSRESGVGDTGSSHLMSGNGKRIRRE
jgi:hypothetical protein